MRTEDTQSFTDFVSAEQAALLRLAVLLAGDRGHAEDLVQTALMKCYRHWARITRSGHAVGLRAPGAGHHAHQLAAPALLDRAGHGDPSRPGGPAAADRTSEDEELRRALRALPPRMRTAVVLRYYEDLSEQRTAELMGCSASTVNTQTARGLARLRASLTGPGAVAPVREERW